MKKQKEKVRATLFIDSHFSEPSKLAERYLKESDTDLTIRHCGNELPREMIPAESIFAELAITRFANSFGEPKLPGLVVDCALAPLCYYSFSGVKSFLRNHIRENSYNKREFRPYWIEKHKPYWQKIETFYPSQRYDKEKELWKSEEKLVTCFGLDKNKIYEGPIEKAPHNLRPILDSHGYNHWHDVSSRHIGGLAEITKKSDGNGLRFDANTGTILFPDEIKMLNEEQKIIVEDMRSIYDIRFEAYFVDKGQLFGLYAYEND